ncbi:MAG: DUF1501 domain-containing protein [Phycisphaerales bacterium]
MNEHTCNACDEYVRLSRRKFMAATTAVFAVPACFPRVSYASSYSSAPQDVIVQIYLRGGMDGMSVVAPWNETNYANARPTIKLTAPGSGASAVIDPGAGNTAPSATAPGGQVVFGFHPAMAPLMTAYNDGKLAIVQATGLTNTNKSHFDAQRFMEVAKINDPTVGTGWLGRHLMTQNMPINPNGVLRAVGVADGLQRSLVGADKAVPIPAFQSGTGNPPTNMSNFDGYGLAGTTATKPSRLATINSMYDAFGGESGIAADNTIATIQLLNDIGAANYFPTIGAGNDPADYPTTSLGNALRSSAALINAQVGVEAIAIDYGGWDTHNNQGLQATGSITDPLSTMYRQIDTLCKAMSAFYADIIVGKGRNVIVVVLTEFGRRLGQNGTVGTDHGYGCMTMVLGNAVDGRRVITNWPGLSPSQPSTNVDLGVTIDCRDILAEIVSERLGNGGNLGAIFPGYTPTIRGVIA